MNKLERIIKEEGSVLMPVAHDAISARIIESVGFKAAALGGFAISGSRFGYPDMGIISYREMRDAVIEITRSTNLPLLVDGDNGYGDLFNIERMVREYEMEPNVTCIFIEDQVTPKRCGHLKNKQIIAADEMVRKIRIAVNARSRKDLWIMARTDARSTDGLDEALRRGEKYLSAGADALFVEAPESEGEMEIIGSRFKGSNLLINMLNGGKTPILPRRRVEDIGFNMIAYPTLTLLLMTKAIEDGLKVLDRDGDTLQLHAAKLASMSRYHDLIGVTGALKREDELREIIGS